MKKPKWFYWLAIIIILPACSLVSQVQVISPSATPIPPTPAEPSPVPPTETPVAIVVTNTPVPTDTPLPATATPEPARLSKPPLPTPTPAPVSATVIMYNGLGKQISVDLSGPEQRHLSLAPKASKEFEVTPGTYNYLITATRFYPLRGSVTFVPGKNTWTLGKAKP